MITRMYVIYDSKSEMYNKPFHMVNEPTAIRAATDLVRDPNSEISKNPEDYAMFYIGNYDDLTATFELASAPICVVKFHEL